MLTNGRDKRFMVRSDGNKVTASTDPSCGVEEFGNLENNKTLKLNYFQLFFFMN